MFIYWTSITVQLHASQGSSHGLRSVCVAEILIHVASTKRFSPAHVRLSGLWEGLQPLCQPLIPVMWFVQKKKWPPTSIILLMQDVFFVVCREGLSPCSLVLSGFTFSFICTQSLGDLLFWLLQFSNVERIRQWSRLHLHQGDEYSS